MAQAGVMPGGGSEPWFWAAREAAANDALARLFYQLAARRDERAEDRNFKEYMYEKQLQDRMNLLDYESSLRGEPDEPPRRNPLGPGAAGSAVRPPPPTAAAPAPAIKTIPGAVAPAPGGTDSFTPGPSGAAPSGKTALSQMFTEDAMNALAQADDNELPANARPTQGNAPSNFPTPRPSRSTTQRDPTTLPRRANPNARTRPEAASFVDIDPKVLQAWDAYEKKYNLPQGTLLTTLGMENDGGRDFTQNPNSSARGLFQWTKDLRADFGIRDDQLEDPYVMGEATARNMRRNADNYTNITKRKIGNSPQDMIKYMVLHQFGVQNGPLILNAADLNPDAPMTAIMYKNPKDPDADKKNYNTLVLNNLGGNATPKSVIQNLYTRMTPWHTASIKKLNPQGEGTEQPTTPTADQPSVSQPSERQGGGSVDAATFLGSRGAKPGRAERLDPVFADRVSAAIQEAERATGSQINLTSTMRTGPEQVAAYRRYILTGRGLAARPGMSRHEETSGRSAQAVDIARGPVLTWMHRNRNYLEDKYGVSFLRGSAFLRDPVHLQMSRRGDPNVRMFKPDTQVAQAPQPQTPTATAPSTGTSPDKPSVRGDFKDAQGRPVVNFFGAQSQPSVMSNFDMFGNTQPTQLAAKQPPMPDPNAGIEPSVQIADVPLPQPRPSLVGENVPLPPNKPQDLKDQQLMAEDRQLRTSQPQAAVPPPNVPLPQQDKVPPATQLSDDATSTNAPVNNDTNIPSNAPTWIYKFKELLDNARTHMSPPTEATPIPSPREIGAFWKQFGGGVVDKLKETVPNSLPADAGRAVIEALTPTPAIPGKDLTRLPAAPEPEALTLDDLGLVDPRGGPLPIPPGGVDESPQLPIATPKPVRTIPEGAAGTQAQPGQENIPSGAPYIVPMPPPVVPPKPSQGYQPPPITIPPANAPTSGMPIPPGGMPGGIGGSSAGPVKRFIDPATGVPMYEEPTPMPQMVPDVELEDVY